MTPEEEINSLQERIEKIFNISDVRRKKIDKFIIELCQKELMIEKLTGLLRDAYNLGYGDCRDKENNWLQFVKDNNL